MRLVISSDSFAIEEVPHGIDLSDLRVFSGVSWDDRRRSFVASLDDAPMLRSDLERYGVRLADEQVRAAVRAVLAEEPVDGPGAVAAYGDARAVPELARALEEFEPRCDCGVCGLFAVSDLAEALEELGGVLTEPQRRKVAEYAERQRGAWKPAGELMREALANAPPELVALLQGVTPRRLGRNDRCPCGSGMKYKRCCLDREPAVATDAKPARH